MCGIAGFIRKKNTDGRIQLERIAGEMATALQMRGPDASGSWADPACGIALSHRRLSIIDLSPAGAQPMESSCGRFVLVYNGEIYNASELRRHLESVGHQFRGHSDTEVLLEACVHWGIRHAVERTIGMFAFAIWDRNARTLTLVRDRLGIKPLYWGQTNNAILFASELKALHSYPDWKPDVNPHALADFLRFSCIHAPQSIYRGVQKLEPGCMVTIRLNREPVIVRYWDATQVAAAGRAQPYAGSDHDVVDELEQLLRDAIARRMVADVPLGAFLSGGVDSSTVAALMQAQSIRPIRTFSIGFKESGYNEATDAARVAGHLGTAHTELYVSPREALDVIPQLSSMYDEPFADASQIPFYLVSRLARNDVIVALSGDGGDELFSGYERYRWVKRVWRVVGRAPLPIRRQLSRFLKLIPAQYWSQLGRVLPAGIRPRQLGHRISKVADMLTEADPDSYYLRLVSQWVAPELLVCGARQKNPILDAQASLDAFSDITDRLRLLDILSYLPDDILTKVDRASMAVSLEARVPLLDHRVVEFSWTLADSLLTKDGKGKWPLRQVLYRYVPSQLVDRPKSGFTVPLQEWLAGPLREWCEDLLSTERLAQSGLEPVLVRDAWNDLLRGAYRQNELWNVLMYQAWHREWAQRPRYP